MRRSRGGDVSLPQPMPDQMPAAATAASQSPRAASRPSAAHDRRYEIGGDTDEHGDGVGGLAAMQRVHELLDKRGPLSKDFTLECVQSSHANCQMQ